MFFGNVNRTFASDKLSRSSRDSSIGALLTSFIVSFGHVIGEEGGGFSSGAHLSITSCSAVKSSAVSGITRPELTCSSSFLTFVETAGRVKFTQASRRSVNFWMHASRPAFQLQNTSNHHQRHGQGFLAAHLNITWRTGVDEGSQCLVKHY